MNLIKNAQIYTFSTIPELTEEALEKLAFHPCGKLDPRRVGFVKPHHFESLIGSVPGFSLICINAEEKILPPSVVNHLLAERIKEIHENEGRPVGRKERQTLKDELYFELMPKAFTKHTRTQAIIDHERHLIIVDAASARKAEDVCSLLREALGSLPVVPISSAAVPSQTMTHWLASHELPQGFELGDYCKLHELAADGATHICRKQDLESDQVATHIQAGMYVSALALQHEETCSFVLTESLQLKQIKFSDAAVERVYDDGVEDKYQEARALLLLCGSTLAATVLAMAEAFGGFSNGEINLPKAS